jgi:hypothetical protein
LQFVREPIEHLLITSDDGDSGNCGAEIDDDSRSGEVAGDDPAIRASEVALNGDGVEKVTDSAIALQVADQRLRADIRLICE